ncbi:MAG: bis(5'-nucleosyl)-tetraphosphatase (symmetrical) YqeK [Eubacteriales bacterium]
MIQKTLEKKTVRLTEGDLLDLSEKVKPFLTEKRYAHTVSVAEEADRLGGIFLSDSVNRNRLRASALLHDITKKADLQKQLQYCEEFGIMIEPEHPVSASVFHGMTGAALAAREFPSYTDADILSGIRWHTTGRYGMTVFESIIYLADYIEPTRTFDDCIAVRRYFWDRMESCRTEGERYGVLRDTMIYSFDRTIDNLLEDQDIIDTNTICARNYFLGITPADVYGDEKNG